MRITGVHFKNLRLLLDVKLDNMPPFMALVGRNATGKSTFMDAFAFLRDCVLYGSDVAVARRHGFFRMVSQGGEGDISISVNLQDDDGSLATYRMILARSCAPTCIASDELMLTLPNNRTDTVVGATAIGRVKTLFEMPAKKIDADFAPLAQRVYHFFSDIVTIGMNKRAVRDMNICAPAVLLRDGGNIATLLKALHDEDPTGFEAMQKRLTQLRPDILRVIPPTESGGEVALDTSGNTSGVTSRFIEGDLSDGTMMLLTYLVLLYAPRRPSLLAVEELESHIFAQLHAELAEEFMLAAENDGPQVLLTTHASAILSSAQPEDVFYVSRHGAGTVIRPCQESALVRSLYAQGDHMGNMHATGVLSSEFDHA